MKKLAIIALFMTLLAGSTLAGFTINSPKTGEKLTKNLTYEIKWNIAPVRGNVKIRLLRNNSGVGPISLSTENDGSFSWKVDKLANGTPIATGDNYQIKIISVNKADVTGITGFFTIRSLIAAPLPVMEIIKKKPILQLLPDLIIASITVSKYNPSVKTTFTVNVKNNGQGIAGAAEMSVWLYKLLPNGQLPSTPNEYWSGIVPAGGGTISFQAIVPWTHDKYEFMTEGNWRVKAKVNPFKKVTESNYNNNEFTYNFSIPN